VTRSVALLRGINVGPTTKVPMATLREIFAEAGVSDITTVLNSGNVVFSGSVDAGALERRIAEATGVTTRVLVVPGDRLAAIADAFPFDGDESKLVITFMSAVPASVDVPPDLDPELVHVGPEALYQSCPNGISNSKLKPAFWRQFPADATARNLRTVKKLVELVG
jgi:uncharacterized protein (DUF1697 family)